MIRIQQVSLMRGLKPLLESADITLNPGDKIGLIGANGTGKSSYLACYAGRYTPMLVRLIFHRGGGLRMWRKKPLP